MYGFVSDQKKFYTFNGGNFFPFFCDFLKISSNIGIFCHPIRKKVDILLDFCPFDLIFFLQMKANYLYFYKISTLFLIGWQKIPIFEEIFKKSQKKGKKLPPLWISGLVR